VQTINVSTVHRSIFIPPVSNLFSQEMARQDRIGEHLNKKSVHLHNTREYIYTYIEREIERERENARHIALHTSFVV
jgi:hypothetical protein